VIHHQTQSISTRDTDKKWRHWVTMFIHCSITFLKSCDQSLSDTQSAVCKWRDVLYHPSRCQDNGKNGSTARRTLLILEYTSTLSGENQNTFQTLEIGPIYVFIILILFFFLCTLVYVLHFILSSTYFVLISSVAHYFYIPSCWLCKQKLVANIKY